MSYRARIDQFQQFRRLYQPLDHRENGSPEAGGTEYTVLNVDKREVRPSDDRWNLWISGLGRLQRSIHDIEQKVEEMKERLSGEQWARIDFTVPSGAAPRDSEFIKSTEKIKQMLSAAQRQICLLTTGSKQVIEGPQCHQLKGNAQRSMNARLGVVMAQFRACQQAFVAQMQRNQDLMSRRVSKAPTKPIQKEVNPHDDSTSGQELLRYADVDRSIQAERSAAIHQIADSVLYLKGILEQMQQMALEQGSMLDRIDMHVQETSCFVAQAREHVERREEDQKDYFVRKCVLLALIGLIFISLLHIATRQ